MPCVLRSAPLSSQTRRGPTSGSAVLMRRPESIRSRRSWLLHLAWSAGLGFLGGCGGATGDSCQVDADCDAPLVCHRASGSYRGRCEDANLVPSMPADSDASVRDPVLPPDPTGPEDA